MNKENNLWRLKMNEDVTLALPLRSLWKFEKSPLSKKSTCNLFNELLGFIGH
jgi:hypothetical protein